MMLRRVLGTVTRGDRFFPRMAGVWGAGVPMVVEPGVLGSVALIPQFAVLNLKNLADMIIESTPPA